MYPAICDYYVRKSRPAASEREDGHLGAFSDCHTRPAYRISGASGGVVVSRSAERRIHRRWLSTLTFHSMALAPIANDLKAIGAGIIPTSPTPTAQPETFRFLKDYGSAMEKDHVQLMPPGTQVEYYKIREAQLMTDQAKLQKMSRRKAREAQGGTPPPVAKLPLMTNEESRKMQEDILRGLGLVIAIRNSFGKCGIFTPPCLFALVHKPRRETSSPSDL